jgi:transformation/transcription domain-associated protein
VLKHLPSDLPKDVEQVTDLLTFVLRTSHGDPPPDPARSKLPHVMSVLFTEIPSQSATVREVAQRCIALVSELTGESVHTLLLPHRERALMSLYTKPLRALQYSTQIGVLEAFTYSLGTTPPIPDVGAELLRLLQETVAYASAEEGSLVGRANARQNMLDVVKLKVSCLRLLAAALPVVDYFSGIPNFQAR